MSTRQTRGRPGVIREVSYGGLVVRGDPPEVVVIVPRGTTALALPKGGGSERESGAEAAVREVREETGIVATVREPLGDVRYWYRRGGRRIFKTVHFFLCDFVGGDTTDHDHEVEDARWIPLADAVTELTYSGERELAASALSKLSGDR
jgi:8-oxo-dGTP pyrophosphatase MutT (NUDIX family)